MAEHPSRALLGSSSAALVVLGALFIVVLVGDSGDNAYSYLAFVGGALIVAGLPFAAAALFRPGSIRRAVVRVALGLLALVGVLGLLLLTLSAAVIPSQNYQSDRVMISHVIGLVVLVAALGTFAAIYRRRFR
jgi:Kef-type K+ transport system membrane component KefB